MGNHVTTVVVYLVIHFLLFNTLVRFAQVYDETKSESASAENSTFDHSY